MPITPDCQQSNEVRSRMHENGKVTGEHFFYYLRAEAIE